MGLCITLSCLLAYQIDPCIKAVNDCTRTTVAAAITTIQNSIHTKLLLKHMIEIEWNVYSPIWSEEREVKIKIKTMKQPIQSKISGNFEIPNYALNAQLTFSYSSDR